MECDRTTEAGRKIADSRPYAQAGEGEFPRKKVPAALDISPNFGENAKQRHIFSLPEQSFEERRHVLFASNRVYVG